MNPKDERAGLASPQWPRRQGYQRGPRGTVVLRGPAASARQAAAAGADLRPSQEREAWPAKPASHPAAAAGLQRQTGSRGREEVWRRGELLIAFVLS